MHYTKFEPLKDIHKDENLKFSVLYVIIHGMRWHGMKWSGIRWHGMRWHDMR